MALSIERFKSSRLLNCVLRPIKTFDKIMQSKPLAFAFYFILGLCFSFIHPPLYLIPLSIASCCIASFGLFRLQNNTYGRYLLIFAFLSGMNLFYIYSAYDALSTKLGPIGGIFLMIILSFIAGSFLNGIFYTLIIAIEQILKRLFYIHLTKYRFYHLFFVFFALYLSHFSRSELLFGGFPVFRIGRCLDIYHPLLLNYRLIQSHLAIDSILFVALFCTTYFVCFSKSILSFLAKLIPIVFLIFLDVFYCKSIINNTKLENINSTKFMVFSSNFPYQILIDRDLMMTVYKKFVSETINAIALSREKNSDYIFIGWPESIFPWGIEKTAQSISLGVTIIRSGFLTKNSYIATQATIIKSDNETYTMVIGVGSEKNEVGFSGKMFPMPIGEYIPKGPLSLLSKFVDRPASFKPSRIKKIYINNMRAWPIICYDIFKEKTYPFFKDIDFIFVTTNEAWFGKLTSIDFRIASKIYAIQNKKPLIKASNRGYTMAVDPFGRELFKSKIENVGEVKHYSVTLPKIVQ